MKGKSLLLAFISIFGLSNLAHATFNSGSTGADGPFNPTGNIEVVLPANGVLNYTTVNIPTGVTVTFKKNAANTPVFLLATGDVTIAGTISVVGGNGTSSVPGKGGSGGFDGGYGGAVNGSGGKALGPGAGLPGITNDSGGSGGGFGTAGNNGCYSYYGCQWTISGGSSYGTANLIPLIGGSGGGGGAGDASNSAGSGGGGGGAIAIASSTLIDLTGTITANGGNGANTSKGDGGGGSGGAVKLVADIIRGNGTITANGGSGYNSGNGGAGRIRMEASVSERTAGTSPAYTYGLPTSVFPTSIPTLNITSVAGTPVPANPAGAYNQPDILLSSGTTNPVGVNISAANIPVGTIVKVWVIPQYGSATSWDATLSGTDQSSTATASVNLSTTYSNIVTAEATFTILQAMYWNGEEIEKVKVAARLGGGSETVYITKSGKEISGELLAGGYR